MRHRAQIRFGFWSISQDLLAQEPPSVQAKNMVSSDCVHQFDYNPKRKKLRKDFVRDDLKSSTSTKMNGQHDIDRAHESNKYKNN